MEDKNKITGNQKSVLRHFFDLPWEEQVKLRKQIIIVETDENKEECSYCDGTGVIEEECECCGSWIEQECPDCDGNGTIIKKKESTGEAE